MTGPKPLVVVGDVLLDEDIEGVATRLAPDAPAPVVDVTGDFRHPGGAGLAAALAARGGRDVVLVTALGDDPAVPVPAQDPASDAFELAREVRARGGTVVATGGCFDLVHAGHVGLLESARRIGDCLIVCLNSDDSVTRRKGPGRPLTTAADRAKVLAALGSVDAVVIFEEDTPERVLGRLRPDVWVKGGDYSVQDLPEAEVLRTWGGQAVVLPYLDGHSTSLLARRAADAVAVALKPPE